MQPRLLTLSIYIFLTLPLFAFRFLHFRLQSLLVDDEDASASASASATAALTPHSAQRVELTAAARRDLAFAPALDDIVERRCVQIFLLCLIFCARFFVPFLCQIFCA